MNIQNKNLSEIAMRNSLYSFSFTMISKIGGIILTIFLARMLLPELFGLYGLVLAVASIALTFTDFGTDLTGTRYISQALGKKNKKMARSFFRFLLNVKVLLTIIAISAVLVMANLLSTTIFNKPLIFLPLIFSCFYIFIESIRSFFGVQFVAKNDLRVFPPLELIFQSSKIILSLLAISILSYKLKIAGIFIAFGVSGILFFILQLFILIKTDKESIFGSRIKIDKKKILKYMGFMGLTGITLIFFGSIDTLMLGRFVSSEYIGYYRAALGIVVSISTLLPFSGVLLPIFTQISGQRLDRGLEKSFRYLIILAIPLSVGMMFLAKNFITLIYGKEYVIATSSLLALSLLIIISPLISLHSTIFQAKGKPRILAKFVIVSLIINIILNYLLIKILLNISQEYAIVGAGISTLISNAFLLIVLIKKTKKQFKISIDKRPIFKSIFATMIMAAILWIFQMYVEINVVTELILIFLGIITYFSCMFLIKGLDKKDVSLLKELFKNKNMIFIKK